MPFPVGSPVAVVTLRKNGQILEVLPGGRYRVAVGGMTMVCREGELETVSQSKKQQKREREAAARTAATQSAAVLAAPVAAPDTARLQSIDLHGLTVPEAMAALGPFLDRAIRAGLARVEIIHGVSGGKLRAAVRQYLAETPTVSMAAPHERNPGVMVAYF
jgi:DNA mismatch repair protein MutS2